MLERCFWYAGVNGFSLSANQTAYDQRIPMRPTADFYARGMGMFNASGAVAARMRRADGAFFTGGADFCHLGGLMDTTGQYRPWAWSPQLRFPRDGSFVFDLRDLGGAGDATIFPVLYGVERYDDGALPPTAMPAKYIEEDYTITVPVTITGAGTQLLEIPIRCDTGDAFEIRAMSWSFNGSEPFTMHCRLWDQHQNGFMNTWVPLRLIFSSIGANYAATPFPSLIIPPKGRFTIDLWNRTEAGPFTIELAFTGVRLVEVG